MNTKTIISDILKIILVLAGVEYAIMFLLIDQDQWNHIWMSTLADASILAVVSTMILDIWLIKPILGQYSPDTQDHKYQRNASLLRLSIFILKAGLIVFVVEVVTMLLLMSMVDLAGQLENIIDAALVSIISTPLIYIWVVKPLYSNSKKYLDFNTKSKLQLIVKRFILIFLPAAIIFVFAVYATQRLTLDVNMENVEQSEKLHISKQKSIIINSLKQVFSDLAFLSHQQVLTSIEDSLSMRGRHYLANDYLVYLQSKSIYDQIRFLDVQGMEIVRANFNNGDPLVVPHDQLQSKRHRYYFSETVGWNENEIYISPFDLNIEHGQIEQPIKPVIRFSTPVINRAGENSGVVILNYLGQTLIDELTTLSAQKQSQFMLLNSDGYWLMAPIPGDEWAFMYEDKLMRKFSTDHPKAWETISGSESGLFFGEGGMYTFETFRPAELILDLHQASEDFQGFIKAKEHAWKLVTLNSPELLGEISREAYKGLELFYILIFLFLVVGSWTLAFVLVTRKRSQDALLESEENYRKIIDESISTIFTTNAQGDLTYINPSAQGLTGYSAEELFDKKFTDIIREDWKEKVSHFYYQQFKNRTLDTALEFPIITKAGEEKWVEQLASLLIDDDERAIGFQSIVYDVSERKKVEKQLYMAKQMAEEASQMKSEFLANMSHELRTPLNSVIGFSNVLLKKNEKILDEKDKNYLERILANGKHLLDLINDVLDLSKIEAGRIELEMVNISLKNLIDDILAQLEGQVQDKQFQLLTNIPEDIAPIQADPGKLKQVIINLLSNAIKFTSDGSVTVGIEIDEASRHPVSISVRDTGIGIPDDRLESVFDEFQQVESSTARKYGGTGLGLAISKSLCELMGYDIVVNSQVGVGSEFTILLNDPEVAKHSAKTREATRQKARQEGTTEAGKTLLDKQILVIDDNLDARLLIEQTLSEEGCRVLLAEEGFKGFDLANKEQPDLIILDLMMKETSGQEVLTRLKSNPQTKDIPVVIVSIVALENKTQLLDAADFVQKPIQPDALVWAVTRHINTKG